MPTSSHLTFKNWPKLLKPFERKAKVEVDEKKENDVKEIHPRTKEVVTCLILAENTTISNLKKFSTKQMEEQKMSVVKSIRRKVKFTMPWTRKFPADRCQHIREYHPK